MKRLLLLPRRALLLLGLLLAGVGAAHTAAPEPSPDAEARRMQRERLRRMSEKELEGFFRGKNPREVREEIGPPQRVARQVFYQGQLEQWVYEGICRVDFLRPLGKEPQFQGVHSLRIRAP